MCYNNDEGDIMKQNIICILILCLMTISLYPGGNPDMIKEFEYSQIDNVEIRGALYAVTIVGKNSAMVKGKIETQNKYYMLHFKQEGNTLVIWYDKPWWAFLSISMKNKLTMEVPLSTNITIENSSGNVDVKNISAEGVYLMTTSGSIFAEYIKAKQRYQSTSGSITVSTLKSPDEIFLKATTGDIIINNMDADLNAHLASGSIAISEATGEKTLQSTSGSINVSFSSGNIVGQSNSGKHTYKGISGNLKAQSTSGSIIVQESEGAMELRTTSGSIKGEQINILGDSAFTATSGSISMDYTNSTDDFTFNLITNSGNLTVDDTRRKKELHTGNGSITITGKTTSGKQTYRLIRSLHK
jgi:DUF4097 and DUF4098 domain-containing protein YvlB